MSIRIRSRLVVLLLVGIAPLVAACVVLVSKGTTIESLNKATLPVTVRSSVKAHLIDGSTIVYPDGIVVDAGSLIPRNTATRYSALLTPMSGVEVPLDSVIGLESYTTRTNTGASLVLSTLGTAGVVVLTAAAAVVAFGSCPTIYADSAGTPVLQAEVFATRVSPLLEARDIDLLGARPDSAGLLTLEVRNEALETHYINHLELLEIRHAVGQRLIPDEHGRPLLVPSDGFRAPGSARDRAGRDLRATFQRVDGDVFSTDSTTLARASGDDPYDYVDIAVARPSGDSAVVGLALRNSLLNTVLLYDMMLAAPGARSLDWLAQDMQRIGPMLRFGRWYREHFGLRVSVWDGTRYREIERHPTYGPVAWREASTVVPVLERDSLRMRLRFAADEWRIDWIGVADQFRRPRTRTIPIDRVRGESGGDSIATLTKRNLRSADERYVQTGPGERFWVSFATGVAPRDSTRTFLLASQGYYSEWVRASWVRNASDTVKFTPSAGALDRTLRRWNTQRDSVARAFYATKIPMRTP